MKLRFKGVHSGEVINDTMHVVKIGNLTSGNVPVFIIAVLVERSCVRIDIVGTDSMFPSINGGRDCWIPSCPPKCADAEVLSNPCQRMPE